MNGGGETLSFNAGGARLSLASLCASAWHSLTRRRWLHALMACLTLGVINGYTWWSIAPPTAVLWKVVLAQTWEMLLVGYALVFAIALADQLATRHLWLPYVAATLLAATLGVAIACFTWPVSQALGRPLRPFWIDLAYEWPQMLLLAGYFTFGHAFQRRSRQRTEMLGAAQLEQARLSRQTLESRLQAMQARVEPQFLFDTLADVERRYETDPALAARTLDDLIVYLRTALPRLDETTSTLEREIGLARAYLDIVKLRRREPLKVTIAVADEARDASMPPMVLIPLIDHVIAHGLLSGDASLRIEASVTEGKLRLTVVESGEGFVDVGPGEAGIEAIRRRLAALYGAEASLALERNDGHGTRAIVEIPWERLSNASIQ
jgi:Histidine kinase